MDCQHVGVMIEFKGQEAEYFTDNMTNAHAALMAQTCSTIRNVEFPMLTQLENFFNEPIAFRSIQGNEVHSAYVKGLAIDFENSVMFAKVFADPIETKIKGFMDTYGQDAMVTTNSTWTRIPASAAVHNQQLKMIVEWMGEKNVLPKEEETYKSQCATQRSGANL